MNVRNPNSIRPFWKWPESSPKGIAERYTISESFRQDVDALLTKIFQFYNHSYLKEGYELRSWIRRDTDKKKSILFSVFDPQKKEYIRSFTIDTAWSIYCYLKPDPNRNRNQPSPSFCVVSTKYRLPHDRTKIGLLIDLLKGRYLIKKKIVSQGEYLFLDHLMSFSLSDLAMHSIQPISTIRVDNSLDYVISEEDPVGQWIGKTNPKIQFFQPYASKSLDDIIKTYDYVEIALRIKLCIDVISSIIFLHDMQGWIPSSSQNFSNQRTSLFHSDIKVQNFVVSFSKKEGRDKAFLIDHELVGNCIATGTYRYLDPRKAQLVYLLSAQQKIVFEENSLLDASFSKLQQEISDGEKKEILTNFHIRHGTSGDVWAAGLVLLQIMCHSEFLSFDEDDSSWDYLLPSFGRALYRFQKKHREWRIDLSSEVEDLSQIYLKQQDIDQDLVDLEEGVFQNIEWVTSNGGAPYSLKTLEAVKKVFSLIRACLRIDNHERIEASSMHRKVNRILKAVEEGEEIEDPSFEIEEDVHRLFSEEAL